MATFLEICQDVHLKSGVQGETTTVSPTNNPPYMTRKIASSVREAWKAIQLDKRDFLFRRKVNSNFHTGTTPKTVYTPTNVFTEMGLTNDLGSYYDDSFQCIFHENRPLSFVHPLNVPLIDNTVAGRPSWYSYDYDNNLILNLTDNDYYLTIYYRREIQQLRLDADVPYINDDWHDLIMFEGLRHFASVEILDDVKEEYRQRVNDIWPAFLQTYMFKRSMNIRGGLA